MRLVVDTATRALCLSLMDGATLVAEITVNGKRQHGELLVSSVAQLLEQAGQTAQAVSELVVGVGPGSYTGLRVGVTFAKTWATTIGTPVYQASSLALMALQTELMALPSTTLVVPVMDARRMTAYTGAYYWDESGMLRNAIADCHTEWQNWVAQLGQTSAQQIVFVGEQLAPFVDAFRSQLPDWTVTCLEGVNAFPRMNATHLLALEQVASPTELNPNYAHATLAEQEWLDKHEGVELDEVVEYLA